MHFSKPVKYVFDSLFGRDGVHVNVIIIVNEWTGAAGKKYEIKAIKMKTIYETTVFT